MNKKFTRHFFAFPLVLTFLLFANHTVHSQEPHVDATWSFYPPPTDGHYEPGDVVNVCFTLESYWNGAPANWLHGIMLDFSPGWDLSSVTNTSAPIVSPGEWLWMPNGFTVFNPYERYWGPGFYYDSNSGGGSLNGNPGDNWGVSGGTTLPSNYTFCFDITFSGDCGGPGNPLNNTIATPRMQITGDAESGSWGSYTLPPPLYHEADTEIVLFCCDAKSGTPPAEGIQICQDEPFHLIDEFVGEVDQGGTWSGPTGWTDPSGTAGLGTFNPLTDPAGDYTYIVVGSDGCLSSSTISLWNDDLGNLSTMTYCGNTPTNITGFVNNSLYSNITVPPGGYWTDPNHVIVTDLDFDTSPQGDFTYHYLDNGICPTTFSITFYANVDGAAGEDAVTEHCAASGCFQPFYVLGGDPVPNGSWLVLKGDGSDEFLGNKPTPFACVDLDSLAWTTNYFGPIKFLFTFSSFPCAPLTSTVTVTPIYLDYVGENTTATICQNVSPIDLTTLLNGTPSAELHWEYDNTTISNILDPNDYPTDTALFFFYTSGVPGSDCYSTSVLTLTIYDSVDAGEDATANLCQADSPVDLTTLLNGTPEPGLDWKYNNTPISNIIDPSDYPTDTPLLFYYSGGVPGSNCYSASALTLTINALVDAGEDATVAICQADSPVDLITLLNGTPDPGLDWEYENTPISNVLDPSNYPTDTPLLFYYSGGVLGSNCYSTSVLTLTINALVDAGEDATVAICQADSLVDLTTLLNGTPDTGLDWEYENTPISNVLDPSDYPTNIPLLLYYSGGLSGTNCYSSSVLTLTIYSADVDAGEDASVAICQADSLVDLTTLLNGTPDTGLDWEYDNSLISNLLNPSDYPTNIPLIFYYSGGLSGTNCYSSSVLTLTIYSPDAEDEENPCESTSISTNNAKKHDLEIYPNPVKNKLLIAGLKHLSRSSYQIITLSGKIVAKQSLHTPSIDVSSLPAGMYVLEIVSHDNIYRSKFIKE